LIAEAAAAAAIGVGVARADAIDVPRAVIYHRQNMLHRGHSIRVLPANRNLTNRPRRATNRSFSRANRWQSIRIECPRILFLRRRSLLRMRQPSRRSHRLLRPWMPRPSNRRRPYLIHYLHLPSHLPIQRSRKSLRLCRNPWRKKLRKRSLLRPPRNRAVKRRLLHPQRLRFPNWRTESPSRNPNLRCRPKPTLTTARVFRTKT